MLIVGTKSEWYPTGYASHLQILKDEVSKDASTPKDPFVKAPRYFATVPKAASVKAPKAKSMKALNPKAMRDPHQKQQRQLSQTIENQNMKKNLLLWVRRKRRWKIYPTPSVTHYLVCLIIMNH